MEPFHEAERLGSTRKGIRAALHADAGIPGITEPLQQVDRTYVLWRGRRLSYFGGCDYFRLSSHPEVLRALGAGLKRFGLNVAASRMTTGNHRLFAKLETALAAFFGTGSALLAASGYVANIVAAQAFAGEFSHALIDKRSHGSLLDAAAFLGCRVKKFRHRDACHVATLAARCGKNARILLLTDGMFAHDGSVAPLREYLRALPRSARLLVDDAHGGGVVGRTGRGALEHEGVARERIIQTVSLSKAFGVYGGAILASSEFRDAMIARSRLFNGNTPLPLPLVNAALKSVSILRGDRGLRRRLNADADYVKDALRKSGLPIPQNPAPIIQISPESGAHAAELTSRLLTHRVFPSLIRYAGSAPHGYFRFMISSEHAREQLEALVGALKVQSLNR